MAGLLDSINQAQDDLLAQFGLDAGTGAVDSLFGDVPVAPEAQGPAVSESPDVSGARSDAMNDQPPVPGAAPIVKPQVAPTVNKDAMWVPGVGFVKQNQGNAAQDWEAAAGSPAPNLAAIQRHNDALLNPNRRNPQGGPGNTPSTVRYYTRKLARATFMSHGASPDARAQAHADLRFQGAPTHPNATSDAAWNALFVRNQNNNFGEGVGEHAGQKLVNEPGGGARFKYLTDLLS